MKLKDFMITPGGSANTQAEWARRVGVTRGYFNHLVKELKVPSLEIAIKVDRVTKGAVTPYDWVTEETSHAGPDACGLQGQASPAE